MGINTISFTNDTSVDFTIKTNIYGFYFESSNTQINGMPIFPGDYGIRFSYIDASGYGLSHYAFMHVSSNG